MVADFYMFGCLKIRAKQSSLEKLKLLVKDVSKYLMLYQDLVKYQEQQHLHSMKEQIHLFCMIAGTKVYGGKVRHLHLSNMRLFTLSYLVW